MLQGAMAIAVAVPTMGINAPNASCGKHALKIDLPRGRK